MSLREVGGPPGAPWERSLNGRLERLTVESELLGDNPLGDPNRRPLYVYLPPGLDEGGEYCTVYVIQGFTGQLDLWLNRTAFEPNMVERLDALFADEEVPRALIVFVDAWTSHGGSQFINSSGTGRYMDYLCDEVVPFVDRRYPTAPAPEHRGLNGKSSGGYGAMVVPMLRPDVFRGIASHAGDALFEVCYLPEFREVARAIRDRFEGSWDVFWERFRTAERFDWEAFGDPFEVYGYALCYSPDQSEPGKALLPFDVNGGLQEDVWARWLEWDPVVLAPQKLDALGQMKRIYLDAGRADEYYLDLGAQAFARRLDEGGIDYTLELFEGKHGGLQYRYPGAIKELVLALSP